MFLWRERGSVIKRVEKKTTVFRFKRKESFVTAKTNKNIVSEGSVTLEHHKLPLKIRMKALVAVSPMMTL